MNKISGFVAKGSERPKKKKDIIQFNDFIKIPTVSLKTIGLFIGPNDRNNISIVVQRISYLFATVVFASTIGQIMFFIKSFTNGSANFIQNTTVLACITFNALSIGKVFALIKNASRFESLASDLKKYFPITVDEQRDYEVKKHYESAKMITIQYYVVLIALISIFSIFGALGVGSVYKNGNFFMMDFVFPMWYPFDPYYHGIFELMNLIQTCASYAIIVSILAVDCLLLTFLQQVCMHFDQLKKMISAVATETPDKNAETQLIRKRMEKHMRVIKYIINW